MMLFFRALPLLVQLGIGAAAIAAVGGGYALWHHNIYQSGYDDAVNDMAARNQVASHELRSSLAVVKACRDSGGVWDQPRGVCGQN